MEGASVEWDAGSAQGKGSDRADDPVEISDNSSEEWEEEDKAEGALITTPVDRGKSSGEMNKELDSGVEDAASLGDVEKAVSSDAVVVYLFLGCPVIRSQQKRSFPSGAEFAGVEIFSIFEHLADDEIPKFMRSCTSLLVIVALDLMLLEKGIDLVTPRGVVRWLQRTLSSSSAQCLFFKSRRFLTPSTIKFLEVPQHELGTIINNDFVREAVTANNVLPDEPTNFFVSYLSESFGLDPICEVIREDEDKASWTRVGKRTYDIHGPSHEWVWRCHGMQHLCWTMNARCMSMAFVAASCVGFAVCVHGRPEETQTLDF
ncbi:hypothetical protein Bca101_020125 [Brassica carinata]